MNISEYFWQIPGLVSVKSLDSSIKALTQDLSKLCFGRVEQKIGWYDQDILGPAARLHKQFVNQDQQVIRNNQKLRILSISTWADGKSGAQMAVKAPYYENGEINGVICNATFLDRYFFKAVNTIMSPGFTKKINGTNSASYTIDNNNLNLSQPAEETLFLLLRGLSNKGIATVLNCSPRTVEHYINELKLALSVSKKPEIIDAAIDNNYAFNIPKSILNKNTSIILDVIN